MSDEIVHEGRFDPATMTSSYEDEWELPEGPRVVQIYERLFIPPEVVRLLGGAGFRVGCGVRRARRLLGATPPQPRRDRGDVRLPPPVRAASGFGVESTHAMATLREVAARAGVDVSTASKVLGGGKIRVAETTRKRIVAAARALDYTPNPYAQGLRLRRKGAIAMTVRNTTNYILPEIVEGAEEAAERLSTNLFLVKQPEEAHADRLLSVIRQGRMDGWIFADEAPCEGFFDELTLLGVPFVTLNRFGPGPGPFVCLDDEAGFRVQAERIVAQGHRKIAFVEVQPASYISRLCRHSFIKRMSELYLPLPPTHILAGGFEGEDAERIAEAILELRPRPTAVACGSMQAAKGLIEALVSRGVAVPEEIGVVGYHDPPTALASRPPLSTVRMPSRAQGSRAGGASDGDSRRHAPRVRRRGGRRRAGVRGTRQPIVHRPVTDNFR